VERAVRFERAQNARHDAICEGGALRADIARQTLRDHAAERLGVDREEIERAVVVP